MNMGRDGRKVKIIIGKEGKRVKINMERDGMGP